jgi:hypothetical protein
MSSYYALLSIVYMIVFVALFDKVHFRRWASRFLANRLLGTDETNRILRILAACQHD